ncbi:terminase small subunit [Arthrobacter phage Liebe]|uniref:Terminase small subunit n=3 Tax=Liebevirus TaxID=2733187 RepID=A0A3G2KHL7_9CAUD|nr:terminase small subunit [Arthrobacter phage Liebe]AYN58482.1 terminase small subunit [Arthrobacter phage Maureen]AZF93734.1 terminase small subunit [Arthrobacter phage Liebe]WGH20293.1 terminase small subunit [Arthrobacter phage MaGuCo]
MAGRGPAPKEHHQRERDTRRRQADVVTVAADGTVRGPSLEEGTGRADWSDATVAWYDRWRRSAQAQLFQSTDWGRLLMLVPIVESYFTIKPSAAALSEIRLNEERLGATYVDRLRAKIRIEDLSAAPDAEVVPIQAAASRESALARLRGEA